MRMFACTAVQRRLQAYHDRELPIHDLIEIEAHAAECARCTDDLREMRALGDALRAAGAPGPADDWAGLQAGVISRMRAEAHESWRARTGRLFEDLHLVWIGLAAALGTVLCGTVALGALHLASSDRDDSLAAMMAVLSAPSGSNLNPVRSNLWLQQVPSIPTSGAVELMLARPASAKEEDVVLAFSAVVTREGRVAGVSVLNAGRPADEILHIMDVLSRATLEPGRIGSSPVAVNLVWLLAHTTVRPEPPRRSI
jgi:hypothetical protein